MSSTIKNMKLNAKLTCHFRAFSALMALISVVTASIANPLGAESVQGDLSTNYVGNQLEVTVSDGAVINWQSFDIDTNEQVLFDIDQNGGSVLNQVVGAGASQIDGYLGANGQLFLINPNGIVFGDSAVINTHSLIASTLSIAPSDFGNNVVVMTAEIPGSEIENNGFIRVKEGGSVLLSGTNVTNNGYIHAPDGHVFMVAADRLTLLNTTTPAIVVDVTQAVGEVVNNHVINASGGQVDLDGALVKNCNCIQADRLIVTEYGELQIVSNGIGQQVSRVATVEDVPQNAIETGCSAADKILPEFEEPNFITQTDVNNILANVNDAVGGAIAPISSEEDEGGEAIALNPDSPSYQPPCI